MRYLVALLLCVPLQFALISFRAPVEKYVFDSLEFVRIKLKKIINELLKELSENTDIDSSNGNSNNDDSSEFTSFETKTRRPPEVFYKVGQIAVNIKVAYIGVIIGWDFKKDEYDEPIYELLTDHPRIPHFKTKSKQSELVVLEFIQIYHEEMSKYFEAFDGYKSQYIPKPWLRIIYPQD